jgi:hypothetical protein
MSVILKIYLILIYKKKSTNKKWWHLPKNPYNIFILPLHMYCQIFAFVWNFGFYLNGIIQDHTSCRSSQECYVSLAQYERSSEVFFYIIQCIPSKCAWL